MYEETDSQKREMRDLFALVALHGLLVSKVNGSAAVNEAYLLADRMMSARKFVPAGEFIEPERGEKVR